MRHRGVTRAEGVTTWAGLVARRLERLTLDNLGDLPVGCRNCVFWELDPVRRQRAADAGSACEEKEAWVSQVLLEWGPRWCTRSTPGRGWAGS